MRSSWNRTSSSAEKLLPLRDKKEEAAAAAVPEPDAEEEKELEKAKTTKGEKTEEKQAADTSRREMENPPEDRELGKEPAAESSKRSGSSRVMEKDQ